MIEPRFNDRVGRVIIEAIKKNTALTSLCFPRLSATNDTLLIALSSHDMLTSLRLDGGIFDEDEVAEDERAGAESINDKVAADIAHLLLNTTSLR